MQTTFDFSEFVQDLPADKAEKWERGAGNALEAVRDITASTWKLASALAAMFVAGGDQRFHNFWRVHLRGSLTLKVCKRLVRLWHAFRNHPERDLLGPDIWAFVNQDLPEEELRAVEEMAQTGASREELREKLEQVKQKLDERASGGYQSEDDIKSVVRRWFERQGHKVRGEAVLQNGRTPDLVTEEFVIEIKRKLGLASWDKAIGQVDSYYWCEPAKTRVLACAEFESATLEILARQAIDNGYRILLVHVESGECAWKA
ncbi:MAG TPA: hypothetical protein PKV98_16325 [Burkholderiaceae bacterium]|nr:hypothetical protein [Burkholderiaceae bacterium]